MNSVKKPLKKLNKDWYVNVQKCIIIIITKTVEDWRSFISVV